MVSGPTQSNLITQLSGCDPRTALRLLTKTLRQAGCPDADYDALELCRFVTGADPRLGTAPLDGENATRLAALTARRAAREPLQYILGSWDFLDFTLKVGPGVLCPRADSEVVCEKAIDLLKGQETPRVLDLCAGTGCLGLGIKRFVPSAQVTCVEIDDAAFEYLTYNASHTLAEASVEAVQADILAGYWRQFTPESVDLIISNPPYLTAQEMHNLMPETSREPALALDGGADGLEFYRCLLQNYRQPLKHGGWLVLEIGCKQGSAMQSIAAENGWQQISCGKDYGGNDRVVVAQRP